MIITIHNLANEAVTFNTNKIVLLARPSLINPAPQAEHTILLLGTAVKVSKDEFNEVLRIYTEEESRGEGLVN